MHRRIEDTWNLYSGKSENSRELRDRGEVLRLMAIAKTERRNNGGDEDLRSMWKTMERKKEGEK